MRGLITRDRFESCAKPFILLRCFSIEFCQNFFCLQSEVPSRDLNRDESNWPRWIRICHFYSPNTSPPGWYGKLIYHLAKSSAWKCISYMRTDEDEVFASVFILKPLVVIIQTALFLSLLSKLQDVKGERVSHTTDLFPLYKN